jgi:hypothetical protein
MPLLIILQLLQPPLSVTVPLTISSFSLVPPLFFVVPPVSATFIMQVLQDAHLIQIFREPLEPQVWVVATHDHALNQL